MNKLRVNSGLGNIRCGRISVVNIILGIVNAQFFLTDSTITSYLKTYLHIFQITNWCGKTNTFSFMVMLIIILDMASKA